MLILKSLFYGHYLLMLFLGFVKEVQRFGALISLDVPAIATFLWLVVLLMTSFLFAKICSKVSSMPSYRMAL
jgi:hypothetical protein